MRRLLEKFADINIAGEAENGVAALEQIELLKPDVVFLDIEMPELDGLGVAETIRGPAAPAVVFVTAYNEHALRAFDVAAVDYLVKPINEERLAATVAKLRQQKPQLPDIAKLIQSVTDAQAGRRLAVRCGSKFIVFDASKISAIIARDHYAAIVADGRELLADDSLDTLADRLGGAQFLRVHRRALINMDYLKELEREGDRKYTAVLNDAKSTRVPVSRERLDDLKQRLGL
jgi:two-component system, LytTR family, response regulator